MIDSETLGKILGGHATHLSKSPQSRNVDVHRTFYQPSQASKPLKHLHKHKVRLGDPPQPMCIDRVSSLTPTH
jgi:hypothetical protein